MKHQLMERKKEIMEIMKISALQAGGGDHQEVMKEYLMEDTPPLLCSMWMEENESGGSSTSRPQGSSREEL